MRNWIAKLLLLTLLVAPAWAGPSTAAGPYQVELETNPPEIPVGKADLVLRVTDAHGMPVEGATVRALAEMPGMKMGEREETAQPREAGVYVAPAAFPMGGGYRITVTIDGPAGQGQGVLSVETGQNTATPTTPLWLRLLPWLLGLGLAGFVAYRLKKTGQRLNLSLFANREVAGGLLLLILMLAVSLYAVRNYRRPGSMTPLEAQIMEMNMPAPPGVMPVELAPVRLGTLEATLRYTGQAVGHEEQDVYARTTGVIEWMPFYAGDRVSRGEVLARLDVTRLDPELAEARAMERMASSEVGVAEAELREAEATVQLAQAEAGGRHGEVKVARAEVQAAQEELRSSAAEAEYRKAQLERSRKLLEEGALSIEEFQKDRAETVEAEVKFEQAGAGLEKARAELDRASSDLEAHHAHVREARAGLTTAQRKIGKATAGLEGARARTGVSQAELGYADIRATLDGVITRRMVSPGVLVQPGQAVLRLARIDPIRLQANVPEADLARVSVGDPVQARDARGEVVTGKVTSVAPALDPATRQAVVEAVVPNPRGRFLPGAYVRLEITTERLTDALTIPTTAVRELARASEEVISTVPEPYVWVAEEAPDGSYTARRVTVELGAGDGENVAVLSGLKQGWLVVTEGAQYLREGQAVTPVDGPGGGPPQAHLSEGVQTAEIRVSKNGFEPKALTLKANVPARLTFTRVDEENCGTEVVFPDLGIEKKLPLNQPVQVELTPEKGRTLTFTCGMDMLKGKLVVR